MTKSTFKYLDPATLQPSQKAWAKVDGPGWSFRLTDHQRPVTNIRGHESDYNTDTSGFSVHHSSAHEKSFTDDTAVRNGYYAEVETALRENLPGVKKVVIFDHTIRRKDKSSPRQPVQQVHVDQTPDAAAARVRRHLPKDEAEELLKGRYQIINVWRPIGHPASDFPLAVVDARSTEPKDFVKVDLMYPIREKITTNGVNGHVNGNGVNGHTNGSTEVDDDDDRGKEALPDPTSHLSTEGYEVKGETFGVQFNPNHRFLYVKDMTPDEIILLKCFDSRSRWMEGGWDGDVESWKGGEEKDGGKGVAHGTPHTAFIDPETPVDAKGRQSIEVRCLVFYE